MQLFKNLSIFQKIITAIALVIFLELLIVGISILNLNESIENIDDLTGVRMSNIHLEQELSVKLSEAFQEEINILHVQDKKEFETYLNNQKELKIAIIQDIELLKVTIPKEHLNLLLQFEYEYKELGKINQEVVDFVKTHLEIKEQSKRKMVSFSNKAILLSKSKGYEAFHLANNILLNISDIVKKEVEVQGKLIDEHEKSTLFLIWILAFLSVIFGLIIGFLIAKSIKSGLEKMILVSDEIAGGNLETEIDIHGNNEMGKLADSVRSMQSSLLLSRNEDQEQNWLKTGIAQLNDLMRGDLNIKIISKKVITEIANYLDAKIGVFYLLDDTGKDPVLTMTSSYAYTKRKNLSNKFKIGEGLVGQAALEKQQIVIQDIPDDYLKVTSGLGEITPQFITVTPFVHDGRVNGVIEIATLKEIKDIQLEYLNQAMLAIAINIESARNRGELELALETTRNQASELQTQQEELKASNEELEAQTTQLKSSEEKLKHQQEELTVSNEELEEKNQSLELQKKEIEKAKVEIEIKADELTTATKYKSEFLANMSHELRTPLNSLLILSKILSDNKEKNLSKDQIESAEVIYSSGNDLLLLINEILDLSKIEAGQMQVIIDTVYVNDLSNNITSNFKHVTGKKGLSLAVNIDDKLPEFFESDSRRLEQILKNLLSNAIKFTKKGGVSVDIHLPSKEVNLFRSGLNPNKCIAISINDTGIGIAPDKQKVIFEAFQQAEGGTSREYGGTGLGLSISRELASLLGGEIQMESTLGKGSTFTLYLPINLEAKPKEASKTDIKTISLPKENKIKKPSVNFSSQTFMDDREQIGDDDKNVLLIIENDPNFAKVVMDLCHEKGFKALVALDGETGLKLTSEFLPVAVVLDLSLPGISGWKVLELLKDNPRTRHIPVHIMSAEDETIDALNKGAIGYLTKPAKKEDLDKAFKTIENVVKKKIKDLLIVEDNEKLSFSIKKLIGGEDVQTTNVSNAKEAIASIKLKKYDCMILDLGLKDMTGFELLKTLEDEKLETPPVIVYTGRELTKEEELDLRKHAQSIIIKGVKSEDRLLDEASLFLHRMVDKLPDQKKKMITNLYDVDKVFANKKVLVVDDDMRNVFALSKVLTEKGFKTLKAENGLKALEILEKESDVDLVLMDIMMPEMDGYETTKKIRAQHKFAKLPIIALTAKAMKKDYEQCIAAGASDYMSKPIDLEKLFSLIRVWMYN